MPSTRLTRWLRLGTIAAVTLIGIHASDTPLPRTWVVAVHTKVSRPDFAAVLGPAADIYASDAHGRTIAHYAAAAARWELVDELFARGYNPVELVPARRNPQYTFGRGIEILTEAARHGELTWLKRLLDAGVKPDTGSFESGLNDAFGLALAYNHPQAALMLLRAGAPLDRQINIQVNELPEPFGYLGNRALKGTRSYVGHLPVHLAAMHRNVDILALLIDERVKLDAANHNGVTAMMMAAAGGWTQGVEMLLAAGATRSGRADLDGKLTLDHAQPFPALREVLLRHKFGVAKNEEPPPGVQLILAIDREDLDAVSKLLASPAAASFVDENGMNAMMLAASWHRSAAVRMLAEHQQSLNTLSRSGNSALTYALIRRDEPMARLLLELGADPNGVDRKKATAPLELAIGRRMFDLANLLLDRGASPIGSRPAGEYAAPPLHRSAALGEFALVQRLLEKGADLRELDSQGYGALMHACTANDPQIVQLLIEKGLDPSQAARDGQTPLALAVRNRNPGVVRALLAAGVKPDPLKFSPAESLNDEVAKEIFALLAAQHGDAYKDQIFWSSQPNRERIMAHVTAGGTPNPPDMTAPLQQAIWDGDFDLARFLLKHGADPSARAGRQQSPLTLLGYNAAKKPDADRVDLARELLSHGADPNFAGPGLNGHSPPLKAAIRTGCVPLVELLLRSGAESRPGYEALLEVEKDLAPPVARELEKLLRKADEPKRLKV